MTSRSMTQAARLAWLVAVWLALWSDITVANVVSGLVVAGAIVVVFDGWRDGRVVVRPLAAARFALHLGRQLVRSSLVVAWTVIAPRGRIHTAIVAVPLREGSDALLTFVADAVNVTPGTLTVEVRRNPPTLFVHALDVRDVEEIRRDIRRLETLARRAFNPRPGEP